MFKKKLWSNVWNYYTHFNFKVYVSVNILSFLLFIYCRSAPKLVFQTVLKKTSFFKLNIWTCLKRRGNLGSVHDVLLSRCRLHNHNILIQFKTSISRWQLKMSFLRSYVQYGFQSLSLSHFLFLFYPKLGSTKMILRLHVRTLQKNDSFVPIL